jgi:ABC-2 type transport system permease protein
LILSLVRKELKKNFKEKGMIFYLFVMPILFIVIFSTIFNNTSNFNIKVHYADQDHSKASQAFLKHISDIKGFTLVQETDVKQTLDQIQKGKVSNLLVIPAGFGKDMASNHPAKLSFYYDGADEQGVSPISQLLENMTTAYQKQKTVAALHAIVHDDATVSRILAPPIALDSKKILSQKVNASTMIVSGYAVMFAFYIMITMLRNFMKGRDSGMFARLSSTPMTRLQYLLGMWIPNVIIVLVQVLVLFLLGHVAYKINIGDPVALLFMAVVVAITTTGLGLAVSFLSKSENAGIGFVQVFTLGGAMLGGLWFPLDMLPTFIQNLSKFVPQYWAQTAFQDIMVRGYHLGELWLPAVILLGFSAVCLLIAFSSYKRFLLSAKN